MHSREISFRSSPWIRRARAALVSLPVVLTLAACASGGAAGSGPARSSAADLGVTDTRPGTGATAATRQCLYVHYVGLLADGRTFDSSRDALPGGRAPQPVVFELGTGAVMPGWEKGLVGLQVGGQRRLWVPYRLAYGAGGDPPAIPPRTDLVFDIELMAVAAPLPSSSNAMRAESARSCPAWETVRRTR